MPMKNLQNVPLEINHCLYTALAEAVQFISHYDPTHLVTLLKRTVLFLTYSFMHKLQAGNQWS